MPGGASRVAAVRGTSSPKDFLLLGAITRTQYGRGVSRLHGGGREWHEERSEHPEDEAIGSWCLRLKLAALG